MPEKHEHKRDLKSRFSERYRFIIQNDETLQEKAFIKLKLWQVMGIFITLFLTTIILTFLVINFTPLKRVVTHWGGIENNSIFIDLNRRIFELEQMIADQDTYKQGIENMLNSVSEPKNIENQSNGQLQNLKQGLEEKVFIDQVFFKKPIEGIISAPFNAEKNHFGVDITAPKNTAIVSILPGTVISAYWNPETGNTISIQHSNDLISMYKHNDSLLKETGDLVKKGESIAIIGNTGELSSGPHLHFEMWFQGRSVDPELYINF